MKINFLLSAIGIIKPTCKIPLLILCVFAVCFFQPALAQKIAAGLGCCPNDNSLAVCSGNVWAWGANLNGGLGDGTTTQRNSPIQANGLSGITDVAASLHSVYLKNDSTVWVCGYNIFGQLGDGTTSNKTTPFQMSGFFGIKAVGVGRFWSFIVKNDGTAWACGNNFYGTLGDGTNTNRTIPVQVSGLTGITAITGGGYHSIALKNDGTVWTWGSNVSGQLGNGTYTNSNVPVQVSTLSGITAIAAGGSHCLALKSDGTVWAWGSNIYGQLGDGSTTTKNVPVQVSGLTGITNIGCGFQYSLAVKSSNTVWAWGDNYYGQLGDNTTTGKITPVQVSGLSNVIAVDAGTQHSMALKNDNTVWTWGYNGSGALGDSTTTDRWVPVHAKAMCPFVLTLTTSQTNVSCNGGNNGYASAIPTSGTAPYTYLWTPGGQTTQTVTGLIANSYTINVTDANGYTGTVNITITQPSVLATSISSQSNANCFGGNDGSATVAVSGGTPGYMYLWSPGGQVAATATGLAAGNYTATITDANGCTSASTVVITQPSLLTASISSQSNVSCFGENDGSATVAATGGIPGYTYLWSPGGQVAATATGLSAGNYTATITDANGCTSTSVVAITQPSLLTASISSQSNVNCFGGSDGNATVAVSGGTPGYMYLWSPGGQVAATATGLAAGNYTATITDANGCASTSTVAITQPSLLTTSISSQSNVNCFGGSDGSATVSAGGGTPGYTYLWSPGGQITAAATGLGAGNYTATITDANGCTSSVSVNITQPTAITVSVSTNMAACGNANGDASAFASGGTPGYLFLWSNGQTTSTITGLSAGTYTITVTDANGCTQDNIAGVSNTGGPVISLSSSTSVTCNGGNDGSATASVSGGSTPYTYSWNTIPAQTTISATGLSAGNYNIFVTDAAGCVNIFFVSISEPAALSYSFSQVNVNCFGGNNGSAAVTVAGGTPAYTYLWSNGASTSAASGLPAGNYTVTTTDSHGCTFTGSVAITEPSVLTASISSQSNVSCFGGSDGSATVAVSGGTTSYTYLWSPGGQAAATATGLPAGNYTATITDSNGCTSTSTAVITQPSLLTASISSQSNVSCFGGNDGSATVAVSGGTFAYTYLWSPGGQITATATGLSSGNYSVTITDSNGCTSASTVVITQPSLLTASISSQSNVSCFGGNDGTAAVSVVGGTPAYAYSWNSGQTVSSATGLAAGNYTVIITDANGCTATDILTITQPLVLATSISIVDASSCTSSDGSASAVVSGGTIPYSYLWSNGDTTALITWLAQGTYTLTVTDANGCTDLTIATVNCLTGVAQFNNQIEFSIYPNPTSGKFVIEIKDAKSMRSNMEIEIYNALGEKIYYSGNSVHAGYSAVDLSSQSNGIYFLNIRIEHDLFTEKIIISR